MKKEIRVTILKMLSLVLMGAGLAFVANSYGPRRIPWVQDWTHHIEYLAKAEGIGVVPLYETVASFHEKSALFVDARDKAAFLTAHIPGAVNVPLGDSEAQLSLLTEARPLIVYCDGQTCDDALNLCRELKANGVENLRLFADGFEMWRRFDQPVQTGADE